MQTILFPGFNIKLNISKIAISIFNIDIYWYAIIIVFAIALAIYISKKYDGKFSIRYEQILDVVIFAIPVALVFARLYYVMFNVYEFKSILEILYLRSGGLAIYGALIGGFIASVLYCKKNKINILDLIDYIAPVVALAQSIGRLGNFINIEAYGRVTQLPWRMGIIEQGKYIEVHPTFLYESIVTFLTFILLTKLSKNRKFRGEITYIYIVIYSFARIFIENLRTDSLMFYNVKISMIVSIVLFVAFSVILIYQKIKTRKK